MSIDPSGVSVGAVYVPSMGWDLRAIYFGRDMGRFMVSGIARDEDPANDSWIRECAARKVRREFCGMSAHEKLALLALGAAQ